jgi:hypothetical protein
MSDVKLTIVFEGKRHDMDIFKQLLRNIEKANPDIKVTLSRTEYKGGK